jgi:hypothetical protein
MKKCIAIVILLYSDAIYSFEHEVISGDSLWSISKHYLGSGNKWQTIRYEDGTVPNPRYLKPGRIVTEPSMQQSGENLESINQVTLEKAPQAIVEINVVQNSSSPVLSFNTASYCCSMETIVMDQHGQFEVVDEQNAFVKLFTPPKKQKMSSFMNIKISEDLINALDGN